jgi:hypothetical protein
MQPVQAGAQAGVHLLAAGRDPLAWALELVAGAAPGPWPPGPVACVCGLASGAVGAGSGRVPPAQAGRSQGL